MRGELQGKVAGRYDEPDCAVPTPQTPILEVAGNRAAENLAHLEQLTGRIAVALERLTPAVEGPGTNEKSGGFAGSVGRIFFMLDGQASVLSRLERLVEALERL